MFKASVQEARLMWGGTLGQRFWRLLVIRMAAGWLWRWCRASDELKLRFAMECRSCARRGGTRSRRSKALIRALAPLGADLHRSPSR
jgi:hypothetical protein